jgi:hypothetical protein
MRTKPIHNHLIFDLNDKFVSEVLNSDKFKIECRDFYDYGNRRPISFISFMVENRSQPPLFFKTDFITNISRGIPPKWFEGSDDQKAQMKLVLDDTQESIRNLKSFLIYLDNYFSSDEIQSKLFGWKKDKHTYEPIIKCQPDDFDEDGKPINPIKKIPYVKLALRKSHSESDNTINTIITDTRTSKFIPVKTISDVADCLPFRKPMKLIIRPSHVWVSSIPNIHSKKRSYGVKIIIYKIETDYESSEKIKLDGADDLLGLCKFMRNYRSAKKESAIISI